jgi:hypothetical protein
LWILLQSSPEETLSFLAHFTYFFHLSPSELLGFTRIDMLTYLKSLTDLEEEHGMIQSILIPLAATQGRRGKGKVTKNRNFDLSKPGTMDSLKNYFGFDARKGQKP